MLIQNTDLTDFVIRHYLERAETNLFFLFLNVKGLAPKDFQNYLPGTVRFSKGLFSQRFLPDNPLLVLFVQRKTLQLPPAAARLIFSASSNTQCVARRVAGVVHTH